MALCLAASRHLLPRPHCGGALRILPRIRRALSVDAVQEAMAPRNVQAKEDSAREFFVYNTLSRQKEVFKPKVPGKVSMYVCGITAYDFSHIGHARVYVSFDVLYRFLRFLGYHVTYVRNFTDIDDKIIKRANELGEDPIKLSDRFCKEFHTDMGSLRCLPPSAEPRVSDHIDDIVAMIAKILENGYGYVIESGDVYFSLDNFLVNFSDYGQLAGRKVDDNRAGERVAVDERKRNPGDFVLWKSSKPGEPSWDSPWGPGRPGWHIECSAMSAKTLGHSFDIHGGGMDLKFPHHDNEIAQSRAACASSDITYWMHNGFVTIDNEKMAKSLNNFFTIRQVLEAYHPLALRWFLLSTHYRSAMNFSFGHLETGSERVFYIYQALFDAEQLLQQEADNKRKAAKEALECAALFKSGFLSSMADDLHLPINSITEPLRMVNEYLSTKKGRNDKSRVASTRVLKDAVEEILEILGLGVQSYGEVLQELRSKALQRAGLTEEYVQERMKERAAARAAKDYDRSDEIRANLFDVGIALMDEGDGTIWRPAEVERDEKKVDAKVMQEDKQEKKQKDSDKQEDSKVKQEDKQDKKQKDADKQEDKQEESNVKKED